MPYREVLRVALDALRANKLRSALTMLGIVIGVAAVIAMLALGTGAQTAVNAQIQALGTTLLSVVPGQVFAGGVASAADRAELTVDDAKALEVRGRRIAAVAPELAAQLQVQFRDANTSTQVVGTTPNHLEVRRFTLAAGRMFTPGENDGRKRVAVVGPTTLADLGLAGPEDLLGQSIDVSGMPFEVVGVLAPKGGGAPFNDPDDQVLIPLQTAQFRVLGSDRLRAIRVLAPTEAEIAETMGEIVTILRREHHLRADEESDFQILNQSDFLATMGQTTQIFSYLLAGIATVSLVVGGIGIMNIMLVSVTERTREIGLRKALGATRANVLLQFLIEAIVLCSTGGIVGVVLGAAGALALREALNWSTWVPIEAVVMSVTFSAVVGIVFGLWPARRAAALDPITALRHE